MPLSDPYAVLQMVCSRSPDSAADLLIGAAYYRAVFICYSWRKSFLFLGLSGQPMITDLSNYITKKIWIQSKFKNDNQQLEKLRYFVIAMSLVISFALGVTAFEFISPISMVHRGINLWPRLWMGGHGYYLSYLIFLF